MTRMQSLVGLIAGLVIAIPAQADDVEPEPYIPPTTAPRPVPQAATEPPPDALDYALIFELAGQWTWTNANSAVGSDLDDDDYPSLEGSARGSIPFKDVFSLQIDIDGMSTFTSRNNGEDNVQTYFQSGGHLSFRNPDHVAAGVFGGGGSSNGGEDENATYWMVGGEVQLYFGNTTSYTQIGYFDADDESDMDVIADAWFIQQQFRHFFGSRDRAQVGFGYMEGDADRDSSGNREEYEFWNWEARFDHQCENTPISLFIGYKGLRGKENSGVGSKETIEEHTAFIGIGFTFGGNGGIDLLRNDRHGATFELPDIGRPTAWTLEGID